MTIVTFDEFRDHLGLTGNPPNTADLTMKLEQAHAIVMDYLADTTDEDWTARLDSWDVEGGSPHEVAPLAVHAAILFQAAELARFRGDDLEMVAPDTPGDLSPHITRMLYRLRRKVFA